MHAILIFKCRWKIQRVFTLRFLNSCPWKQYPANFKNTSLHWRQSWFLLPGWRGKDIWIRMASMHCDICWIHSRNKIFYVITILTSSRYCWMFIHYPNSFLAAQCFSIRHHFHSSFFIHADVILAAFLISMDG